MQMMAFKSHWIISKLGGAKLLNLNKGKVSHIRILKMTEMIEIV